MSSLAFPASRGLTSWHRATRTLLPKSSPQSAPAAMAPHPNPLPASGERAEPAEREGERRRVTDLGQFPPERVLSFRPHPAEPGVAAGPLETKLASLIRVRGRLRDATSER